MYFTFILGENTDNKYHRIDADNKSEIVSNMADEPPYQMAYACENEILTINCTNIENERSGSDRSRNFISLEIIRANFGRFSISICNNKSRADISVNCQSHSTLKTMKEL